MKILKMFNIIVTPSMPKNTVIALSIPDKFKDRPIKENIERGFIVSVKLGVKDAHTKY